MDVSNLKFDFHAHLIFINSTFNSVENCYNPLISPIYESGPFGENIPITKIAIGHLVIAFVLKREPILIMP